MQRFYEKYISAVDHKVRILDVGSQLIDGQQTLGSYKSIFDGDSNVEYVGCDMVEGLNVDIILADPYNWSNIEENSFDFVISGQMLEHVEYPWHTLIEINRVLKPEGVCCIIAPSAGAMHNYPLDCFRYYPDGMAALAKYAGLDVLESYAQWEKDKYPYMDHMWHDAVLIARKKPATSSDEAVRRECIFKASEQHLKNDDFISMNPVLDPSLWFASNEFVCKIYLDTGNGFSEKETLMQQYSLNHNGYIVLKYTVFPSSVRAIRLDPCDRSCIVSGLTVKINDTVLHLKGSNAVKSIAKNDRQLYLFNNNDPQFFFSVSADEKIFEAEIEFDIAMVSENIIECL